MQNIQLVVVFMFNDLYALRFILLDAHDSTSQARLGQLHQQTPVGLEVDALLATDLRHIV
jgi:hypothetical protein